jgi:hypothetical protein
VTVGRDSVIDILKRSGLHVCSVSAPRKELGTDTVVTLRMDPGECRFGTPRPEVKVSLIAIPDRPYRMAEVRAATFRECQLVATIGDWVLEAGTACGGSSSTSTEFLTRVTSALSRDSRVRIWDRQE